MSVTITIDDPYSRGEFQMTREEAESVCKQVDTLAAPIMARGYGQSTAEISPRVFVDVSLWGLQTSVCYRDCRNPECAAWLLVNDARLPDAIAKFKRRLLTKAGLIRNRNGGGCACGDPLDIVDIEADESAESYEESCAGQTVCRNMTCPSCGAFLGALR